jgi:hypothetical protein
MKKDVMKKIEVLTKEIRKQQKTDKSLVQTKAAKKTVNSLSENIKTQEQADTFKKILSLL